MRRSIPVSMTLPLVLVALAVTPPLASAAEKWKLRLDPAAGAGQRYALTTVQNMDMQLGALGQQKGQSTMRLEFAQHVRARRPDGGVTMEVAYERVKMDVSMGGFSMSYDSASPDTNPQAQMLGTYMGKLVGEKITVQLSPLGVVEEVTGLERLWEEMTAEAGDDPAVRQALESLRKSFNSETLVGLIQQGTMVFPEQAVHVGEVWRHETTMPNPLMGDILVSTRYEVQGAEKRSGRDCVKIANDQKLDFEGNGPLLDQLRALFGAGGDLDWGVEQAESAGTVWIDPSDGLTVGCESNQKMAINVAVKIPQEGGAPQEMNIHMVIDQELRMELLD